MCGIAGAIAADRRDVRPVVLRLTDELAHRGPDGSGFQYLREPWAAFGHRRLSIVDLATGDQPMANEDGKVWVVLNGEIYNHLDLRRELEQLGHRFRTRADTEVLVHGWEEWGKGLLGRLNGIYALALFDGRGPGNGEVVLARDPVGVKPLYVGTHDGQWWFASELAAARTAGLVDGGPTRDALGLYLVYRFIPSPATPFARAWKLPPAHLLEISLDALPCQPRFEAFDHVFAPPQVPRGQGEWEEALRAGLQAAVRRQLMSDVPVGSLLSGGVDSTVVTRHMCDALPERPLCFGIGFADAPEANELGNVQRAAVALGVPLETVAPTESEYLSSWPGQIASLGEPIANSGTLLIALLCRLVRHHRKVVLSGQGADEPLGGYPRHSFERWASAARALRALFSVLPEGTFAGDRVARLRRMSGEAEAGRRIAETLAVFGVDEAASLARLNSGADLVAPVRYWLERERDGDDLNNLLRVDARLSLADDLLIVGDHMSMAASVELRVPFLDLEFVSLVERMPGRYKVSLSGERKWLYRRAMRDQVPFALKPTTVGWRARTGRKLGFSTPLERWFAKWVAETGQEFLLGPGSHLPEYLSVEPIVQLVEASRRGAARGARQLMALYVLEVWMRQESEPRFRREALRRA